MSERPGLSSIPAWRSAPHRRKPPDVRVAPPRFALMVALNLFALLRHPLTQGTLSAPWGLTCVGITRVWSQRDDSATLDSDREPEAPLPPFQEVVGRDRAGGTLAVERERDVAMGDKIDL